MKLLLYCTKAKPYLYGMYSGFESKYGYHLTNDKNVFKEHSILNGKIVAECDFEVEDIELIRGLYIPPYLDTYNYVTKTIKNNTLVDKACLTYREMEKYFGKLNYGGKNGYAIHIKNLNIFDKPRELYDCLIHPKIEPKYYGCEHLSKAPQNMMYVELDDIKYILISIRPQWLCKILNGEKTIEVRKKVLKEMLE